MAMLNDYRCFECGSVAVDAWSDDIPKCCGRAMNQILLSKTFEWGGPKTFIHIRDEPFSSRSELADYAKANGMSLGEASEKVGGARNDMYDGIGRTYSYPGASCRDNPLANVPRRDGR